MAERQRQAPQSAELNDKPEPTRTSTRPTRWTSSGTRRPTLMTFETPPTNSPRGFDQYRCTPPFDGSRTSPGTCSDARTPGFITRLTRTMPRAVDHHRKHQALV